MVTVDRKRLSWVILVYRVPRLPSAPRIAIWRRLRTLGVAHLSDGVVALPEDARTREHLEWVADEVVAADGEAILLQAQTMLAGDEIALARSMATARAAEYAVLIDAAAAAESDPGDAARTLRRLRKELRRIQRRDHFPPPERVHAVLAIAALARNIPGPTDRAAPRVGLAR